MTRAALRARFARVHTRGRRNMDFICLRGVGIRVVYRSGRVVMALTANPRYALAGIRAGAWIVAAARRLGQRTGDRYRIGRNRWYLIPGSAATGVLKVQHAGSKRLGSPIPA